MREPSQFSEARVVIAIPLATAQIYWRVVAAVLEMDKPEEVDLMVFQGALVDRARNQLVEQMLNHAIKPTHLFFLDSDILPAPDTLKMLLSHEASIVSGLYRRRLTPHEPVAYRFDSKKILQPIVVPSTAKGRKPIKVDMVGAGCLLIEREVFEKVKAPWFVSEWKKEGHLSEDFYFCQKARDAGFEILVDPKVTPLHLDPMGIGTSESGDIRVVSLS